jgi:hypothetical protein
MVARINGADVTLMTIRPKFLLPRDVLGEPSTSSLMEWYRRSDIVFHRVANESYNRYNGSESVLIDSGFSGLLYISIHPYRTLAIQKQSAVHLKFLVDLCDALVL